MRRSRSTAAALASVVIVALSALACAANSENLPQPSEPGKAPNSGPAAEPPALESVNSAACGLEAELEALTRTAADPEQAAAALVRPLLGPAQAHAYAGAAAQAAVDAIAGNSFPNLAALVDPDRGLCLRPAKGAPCRQMSIQELRACAEAKSTERWDVDDGSDTGPSYTCRDAFARIFLERSFRQPSTVRYNCFPEVGRGNNANTILTPPLHRAYVEYFAEELPSVHAHDFPLAWRSLWLVFDGDAPRLVELIAEYWGP